MRHLNFKKFEPTELHFFVLFFSLLWPSGFDDERRERRRGGAAMAAAQSAGVGEEETFSFPTGIIHASYHRT